MNTHTMDDFVQAYEQLAAQVEQVVSQYPPEMRDDLRAHAQEVLRLRLQELWEMRQRRRALLS